jgi:hypothetical protein
MIHTHDLDSNGKEMEQLDTLLTPWPLVRKQTIPTE